MRIKLLVVVAAGLLVAADKGNAKKGKDDLKGTWKIDAAELEGKKVDLKENQDIPVKLVIDDKKITATVKNEDHSVAYTLDSSKAPKHMDIVPDEGPNQGKTLKAIYELKGDTLTICVHPEDSTKERPKKLASKEGSGLVVVVFKRAKK